MKLKCKAYRHTFIWKLMCAWKVPSEFPSWKWCVRMLSCKLSLTFKTFHNTADPLGHLSYKTAYIYVYIHTYIHMYSCVCVHVHLKLSSSALDENVSANYHMHSLVHRNTLLTYFLSRYHMSTHNIHIITNLFISIYLFSFSK